LSSIFQHAAQQWYQMKSDYLSHVDNEYDKALEACSGVLVNKEGRELHVDGYSLFTGTERRALKYASEELLDYWLTNPRLSVMDFELMWMSGQIEMQVQ
jgi:hypothetical protein